MPIADPDVAPVRRIAVIGFTRRYRSAETVDAFTKAGFTVIERPCDFNLTRIVSQVSPDVVVLAVNPSREDDQAVVRSVAAVSKGVVVVLGPGHESAGFSQVLNEGADVCLCESFGTDQIAEQVRVLCDLAGKRRPVEERDETLTVGDLAIDTRRCEVRAGNSRLSLSPTEFNLLAILAKHPGRVMSPVEIYSLLHDYPSTEEEARNATKVYVRRVRAKLAALNPDAEYIVNVRGFGYMLNDDETQAERRLA